MDDSEYTVENNGENHGVIVGENNGNITLSLQRAVKIPSLISEIIRSIGIVCSADEIDATTSIPKEFKPEKKIAYNSVSRYKFIIKEFSAYFTTCDEYLDAYDDCNIRGKARILKCIKTWYLKAKGKVISQSSDTNLSEMDIIRKNSDNIIDMVKDDMYQIVMKSSNLSNMYSEDIELGIICFTCYCFMKCKILEKPV